MLHIKSPLVMPILTQMNKKGKHSFDLGKLTGIIKHYDYNKRIFNANIRRHIRRQGVSLTLRI